jgi:hypothetical protein
MAWKVHSKVLKTCFTSLAVCRNFPFASELSVGAARLEAVLAGELLCLFETV